MVTREKLEPDKAACREMWPGCSKPAERQQKECIPDLLQPPIGVAHCQVQPEVRGQGSARVAQCPKAQNKWSVVEGGPEEGNIRYSAPQALRNAYLYLSG